MVVTQTSEVAVAVAVTITRAGLLVFAVEESGLESFAAGLFVLAVEELGSTHAL